MRITQAMPFFPLKVRYGHGRTGRTIAAGPDIKRRSIVVYPFPYIGNIIWRNSTHKDKPMSEMEGEGVKYVYMERKCGEEELSVRNYQFL